MTETMRCPTCGGPVKFTQIYVGTSDDARFANYPTVPGMAYCADPTCFPSGEPPPPSHHPASADEGGGNI